MTPSASCPRLLATATTLRPRLLATPPTPCRPTAAMGAMEKRPPSPSDDGSSDRYGEETRGALGAVAGGDAGPFAPRYFLSPT